MSDLLPMFGTSTCYSVSIRCVGVNYNGCAYESRWNYHYIDFDKYMTKFNCNGDICCRYDSILTDTLPHISSIFRLTWRYFKGRNEGHFEVTAIDKYVDWHAIHHSGSDVFIVWNSIMSRRIKLALRWLRDSDRDFAEHDVPMLGTKFTSITRVLKVAFDLQSRPYYALRWLQLKYFITILLSALVSWRGCLLVIIRRVRWVSSIRLGIKQIRMQRSYLE